MRRQIHLLDAEGRLLGSADAHSGAIDVPITADGTAVAWKLDDWGAVIPLFTSYPVRVGNTATFRLDLPW